MSNPLFSPRLLNTRAGAVAFKRTITIKCATEMHQKCHIFFNLLHRFVILRHGFIILRHRFIILRHRFKFVCSFTILYAMVLGEMCGTIEIMIKESRFLSP